MFGPSLLLTAITWNACIASSISSQTIDVKLPLEMRPSPAFLERLIKPLRKAGVYVRYPIGMICHRGTTFSRYEAAVAGHAVYQSMNNLLFQAKGPRSHAKSELANWIRQAATGFDAMELLILSTLPELEAMGVDIKLLKEGIERLAKGFESEGQTVRRFRGFRFPDVPTRHWADRAVQELWSEGLLSGYPDGKFRG